MLENFTSLAPLSATSTISEILTQIQTPLEAPSSMIDNTQDMARLFIITEDLDSVKNDAQQRSWELFDDQATIIEYLNELNCILVSVSKYIESEREVKF